MEMEKDMDRFIALLDEKEEGKDGYEPLAYSNVQCTRSSRNFGWGGRRRYKHRCVIRNKAALIEYETFVGVCSDDGQMKQIICIARADTWMTRAMEDRKDRLKGVGRGDKEPHVLKTRYNALPPVATANLQV